MPGLFSLTCLVSVVLSGCFHKDDTGESGEYYVRALVDGQSYQGGSQGGAYNADVDPTELMLWPADAISGYLWGWAPGTTGSWTLSDAAGSEALLFYFDDAMNQYASTSGTLTFDSWQDHLPDNSADSRIGFIRGTFSGSFYDELTGGTVEVTEGEFYSMVTES